MENTILKCDLKTTTGFCDENMTDINRGAAIITVLQSEIMNLLGRMVVGCPQRPQQESDILHDSTPFVVVLIDGDRTMLLDEHVKRGCDGGSKAAQRFHKHLLQYLTERKVFQNHWKLMIKFYASMSRLGTAYIREGLIDGIATWRQFIDGFNKAFPFCYFLDAGDNGEKVSSKVQDQLSLFFGHSDCKHTVLVSSANDAYTGFLRQYTTTDNVCGRITLVEAIPFPGAFQELASQFLPNDNEGLFSDVDEDHFLPQPRSTIKLRVESLPESLRPGPANLRSSPMPFTPTPVNRLPVQQTVLPSRGQVIRQKPLATIQTRLPRPRNAFFNSQGQRIDSKAYVSTYTERYLQW